MPFTGKRHTKPPAGAFDIPPPPKRRKGKALTGRYITTPPVGLQNPGISGVGNATGNSSAGEDPPTSTNPKLWVWTPHETTRTSEFRKTTVPIDLSDDSEDSDAVPSNTNTSRPAGPQTEYGAWDRLEDAGLGSDDEVEGIHPRPSGGKVCDLLDVSYIDLCTVLDPK